MMTDVICMRGAAKATSCLGFDAKNISWLLLLDEHLRQQACYLARARITIIGSDFA
jgi:hypothetical protein